MANTRHLKRHSMPTSWPVKRKNITFVAKPQPGSHKRDYVTSVVVLLRDELGYAQTSKEAKRIVHEEEILVNGKKVTDIKSAVGIFDVFEIKKTSEKFTVLFNEVGRLKLVATKEDLIYLKVSKKTLTPGKKCQLNFMNGFNLLVDEKTFAGVKVNDTVVYDFAKKKISSIMNLKEKAQVYFFDGKFKGQFGEVKSFIAYNGLARDVAQVEINETEHNTAKDYCFVIGAKKADIKRFE